MEEYEYDVHPTEAAAHSASISYDSLFCEMMEE